LDNTALKGYFLLIHFTFSSNYNIITGSQKRAVLFEWSQSIISFLQNSFFVLQFLNC
jgi:hypothetical protein